MRYNCPAEVPFPFQGFLVISVGLEDREYVCVQIAGHIGGMTDIYFEVTQYLAAPEEKLTIDNNPHGLISISGAEFGHESWRLDYYLLDYLDIYYLHLVLVLGMLCVNCSDSFP